jgi:hypothetical protein
MRQKMVGGLRRIGVVQTDDAVQVGVGLGGEE